MLDDESKGSMTAGSAPLGVATLAALAALAWSDWRFGIDWNPTVAYPTLLLVCLWVRSRRFLWLLTVLSIACSLGVAQLEIVRSLYPDDMATRAIIHRLLGAGAMLVTAIVFHYLINSWSTIESASI